MAVLVAGLGCVKDRQCRDNTVMVNVAFADSRDLVDGVALKYRLEYGPAVDLKPIERPSGVDQDGLELVVQDYASHKKLTLEYAPSKAENVVGPWQEKVVELKPGCTTVDLIVAIGGGDAGLADAPTVDVPLATDAPADGLVNARADAFDGRAEAAVVEASADGVAWRTGRHHGVEVVGDVALGDQRRPGPARCSGWPRRGRPAGKRDPRGSARCGGSRRCTSGTGLSLGCRPRCIPGWIAGSFGRAGARCRARQAGRHQPGWLRDRINPLCIRGRESGQRLPDLPASRFGFDLDRRQQCNRLRIGTGVQRRHLPPGLLAGRCLLPRRRDQARQCLPVLQPHAFNQRMDE